MYAWMYLELQVMPTQYGQYNELWRLTPAGRAPEEGLCTPKLLIAALNAARRGRALLLEAGDATTTVAYILPRKVGSLLICASGQVYIADEARVEPPRLSQYPGFFGPNDKPYTLATGTHSPDQALYYLLMVGLPHVQRPLPGGSAPLDEAAVNAGILETVEYGLAADQQRRVEVSAFSKLLDGLDFDTNW